MTTGERTQYTAWVAAAEEAHQAQRWSEAQHVLEQVLELEERTFGPSHPEAAGTLAWLGLVTADPALAERRYRRAMEIYDGQPGDMVSKAVVRSRLGNLLLDSYRAGEALPLLERAMAIGRAEWGERDRRTADVMNLLARALLAQNRHSEGRALLEREIALRTSLLEPFADSTLDAMAWLVNARPYNTHSDEERELRRRVFQLTLDHWDGRSTAGAKRLEWLSILLIREPGGEALVAAAVERVRRAEGDHANELIRLLDALRGYARGRDDFATAESFAREAIEIAERSTGRAASQAGNLRIGLVDILMSQPSRRAGAVTLARRLRDDWRDEARRRDSPFRTDENGLLSDTSLLQSYSEELLTALWFASPLPEEMPEEAFEAIQDATSGPASRAIARSAALADADAVSAGPRVERRDRLAQTLAESRRRRDVVRSDSSASALAEAARLDREIPQLELQLRVDEAALRTAFPAYFDYLRNTPLTRREAQTLIGEDEAVLFVVPGNYGTVVALATRGRISWRHVELNWYQAGQRVYRLRRDLECRETRCAYDRETAFGLYQELIAPFAGELAGKRHLFVVATKAFGIFPLGALVTEPPNGANDDPVELRGTAWLADRHAIIQLPSLHSLALQRRPNRRPPPSIGFAGFGAPDMRFAAGAPAGSNRRRNAPSGAALSAPAIGQRTTGAGGRLFAAPEALRTLPRLAGAANELDSLRLVLNAPANSVRVESQATEPSVRDADLSGIRVIAFATHASLPEQFGLGEPGLVFSPPASPDAADDGLLVTSEILQLRLRADLVILSACNTGAVERGAGDTLSGLARAFFFAGARTLMVSHWLIRDDLAPMITVRMLAIGRNRPSLSRAEALQRAMRETRDDPGHPEFAHPGVWAAFTLAGDATQ